MKSHLARSPRACREEARSSPRHSFIIMTCRLPRPTWFWRGESRLLSCRNRRGRSQEHLQLSLPPRPANKNQLSPQTALFLWKHPGWTGKVSRELRALSFQEWLVSLKVPGWFESLKSKVKWSSPSLIVHFRFDTTFFQCVQSPGVKMQDTRQCLVDSFNVLNTWIRCWALNDI